MKNENSYQGWNNYETWLVSLHIDNDQSLSEMMDEQLESFISEHTLTETADDGTEKEVFDKDEHTGELAHVLKDWFEEMMEEFSPTDSMPCFYRDCIQSVLGSVDWYEIAQNKLNNRE